MIGWIMNKYTVVQRMYFTSAEVSSICSMTFGSHIKKTVIESLFEYVTAAYGSFGFVCILNVVISI